MATPPHLGRTLASYEVVIADEQDRRVCTCRIACSLIRRERVPRQPYDTDERELRRLRRTASTCVT